MKKRTWITIVLVIVFIAGLSLLLYPTFSDHWNSTRSSHAIASYVESVNAMDKEKKKKMWEEAVEYNEDLKTRKNPYKLTSDLRKRYDKLLDIGGNGLMGYVEIPSIDVLLPIYHGTEEAVLQTSIGHIDWTYLPIGGEGTHSAISGHRGLVRAKLFSDLDRMVVGDIFMLRVLDETLTYEVDQVLTVEPTDVTSLRREEGADYCTLETCTPYGVNTHRLLIRGHRIPNLDEGARLVSEATQIEPLIVAPVMGVPMLIILLIIITVRDLRSKKSRELTAELKQKKMEKTQGEQE